MSPSGKPSDKPQVKRFVKNKPKPWFSFDIWSWRDRKIAALVLGLGLAFGARAIETLKTVFVPTEEEIATQEALDEFRSTVKEVDEKEAQRAEAKERKEGEALHQAGALDWQQATYEDKLEACTVIVAQFWKDGIFVSTLQEKIETTAHVRFLAEKLVEEMDKTMAPLPDAEENRKTYVNQSVGEMAVLTMVMLGWISN